MVESEAVGEPYEFRELQLHLLHLRGQGRQHRRWCRGRFQEVQGEAQVDALAERHQHLLEGPMRSRNALSALNNKGRRAFPSAKWTV